jgi:hypothetical protein
MKPKKIEILKLKPKRRRIGKNVRNINNVCPYCLSILKVGIDNKWYCTSEKLNVWKEELVKYQNLPTEQQLQYLNTISNKDKFAKWVESSEVECEYNAQKKQS